MKFNSQNAVACLSVARLLNAAACTLRKQRAALAIPLCFVLLGFMPTTAQNIVAQAPAVASSFSQLKSDKSETQPAADAKPTIIKPEVGVNNAISILVLPTVNITAPANAATFVSPATVAITATAADTDGTITKVEFFNGAALLGTDTTSPYSFNWTNVAAGSYAITAKATDNAGGVKTSTAVNITVNTLPTVNISAPANNATFTSPATVALAATAADANGTITKVEFFNGATSLGVDTTSPYTFSWTNVAAGSYAITAKATDNAGAVTTSAIINITVTAPNTPPTVSLTAPANNATFTAPATVALAATAADANGTVTKVEFFNGATSLGVDTTSPYTFSWTNVAAGSYAITAKATDNAGAVTTSGVINITVSAPNTPPTVSLTAPANNATFTAPATVALSATAADSNGTVTQVEFFNGATSLGVDTTSPYTFSWTNVAAGTYAITAKATDNAGAVTTSSIVNITVSAPNTPPSVSLTAPANNATFTAPATVALAATAADSNGTVTQVEFFNGATSLGVDTTSPYTFSWTNVAAGTYAITAKATDNAGAVTTSSIINITVSAPNTPPTVSLSAPANNATFTAPATVALAATAADSNGTVTQVEFFNGPTSLGVDTTSPYTFSWTNVAAGTYAITAKATDNAGAVTTSSIINITVSAANTPPTVSITAPANNATFTAPATVALAATAADSNGTVTQVEFFNGATSLGVDTTSPYTFSWTNVAAGTYAITAKATDNAGAVTTSSIINITVSAPNTPPTVSLSSPANNATFTAPATVALAATAADSNGTVTQVEFFNGATSLGVDTTSPYTFNWTNVAAGTYAITAKATDNAGAVTTSSIINITVSAPNTPPTVSLSSPANNATFTAPATVALAATAADSNGTVTQVEFFNGATSLGVDTTSPYTFSWTNVAAGSYAITAKATDNAGAVTTSSIINVTVSAANTPPTVSITAPANNATFTAPATVALAATAADSNGTITKVEFFNSATSLGIDTTSPYTFSWTNVAAGSYAITAKATDNAGAVTTSSIINITVSSNTLPTVSLTAPADHAAFTGPASIALAATAADVGGSITKVEFFNGATLLGSDTSAPYTRSWTGVAIGDYVVTAKATDNSGGVTTSAPLNIHVTDGLPYVNIVAPINNATFVSGTAVPVSVIASAVSGKTISKVEYYVDNILWAMAPTAVLGAAPVNLTSIGVGNHNLFVYAYDSSSNVAGSALIAFTVTPQSYSTSITTPANGATYMEPATVALTAAATAVAPGTAIARIDYYRGTTLLGGATTAPYSYTWSGAPSGRHHLTAVATDNLGATKTSGITDIVVDSADTCIGAPPLSARESAEKLATFNSLPITFEANNGQSNSAVKFQARTPNFQLFLTEAERVLVTQQATPSTTLRNPTATVSLRFVGANPHPRISGADALEQTSNYLNGSNTADWHTNIGHFAKARYHDIYPGIDELYYGDNGKLEYDLIVAPNADPSVIRLAFSGVSQMTLSATGDLLLTTANGILVQKRPIAYQEINGERREVTAQYLLNANDEVTFEIGEYDANYALVIDPILVFSTRLSGTNGYSTATGVAVSRCGETYLVGTTISATFPTTAGAFDTIGRLNPTVDQKMAFVSKFNAAGSGLLYSTYLTGLLGNTTTEATAIALDNTGHAYVVGSTASPDFPVTPNAAITSLPSGASGFIAKLNNGGNGLLYSSFLPVQSANAVAVDSTGAAYIAGDRQAIKINATGAAIVYNTAVGTTAPLNSLSPVDKATAIAVDATGNAYVAGNVSRDLAATVGAFQTTKLSVWDGYSSGIAGFVTKINATGTGFVYSTYIDAGINNRVNAIALDAAGNAYIAGTKNNTGFPPNYTGSTKLFADNLVSTSYDFAYAAKLNATGSALDYFAIFGGGNCTITPIGNLGEFETRCVSGSASATAIAIDTTGNAWVTGPTTSTQLPVVRPIAAMTSAILPTQFSAGESFVAKLNAAGDRLFLSSRLPTGVASKALAVDAIGNAYVAGDTTNASFPTTPGSFQTTAGANSSTNAVVFKVKTTNETSAVLTISYATAVPSQLIRFFAVVTGNTPTGTVSYFNGTTLLGTVTLYATETTSASAGFEITLAPGNYTALRAQYGGDPFNDPSSATAASFTVIDPNVYPTINLTASITNDSVLVANTGSTFTGGTVSISASTPSPNTLKEIKIYLAGQVVSTTIPDTSNYTQGFALPALNAGYYILYATAKDAVGHITRSNTIRFVVNATGAASPTVAITAPTDGAVITSTAPFTITANATAASGSTISYVAYILNDALKGQSYSAPHTYNWNSLASGTYTLFAVASASNGTIGMSPTISFTVNPLLGPLIAPRAPSGSGMLNSVVFTLLPPYSTGGSAIVSYSASCTSPGRPTRVATALASAGTITVTNLTGGAIYRCTMTATNATTTSAESAFSSMLPIAPLGTPSSPVLPNYVPGINQATLRFIPGSAGDAPITSYTTICSAAGQSTVVITAAGTVEGSQTAMLITGLVGGVAYSCNVAANNSVGTGTTSGSITVIAASGPPLISITWPAANAAITPSTSGTPVINITLRGQDTPVGIVRIETFVDGVSVSYTTEQALPAVYVINTQAIWNSPTLGTHIITAKMTDANGTVYDSAPITIQVFAAPAVSIYAPYTFYLAPASIDVTAIATIAVASVGSTITKIEYLDITNVNVNATPPVAATIIATLTTAPYALRWSGSGAGGTGSGLPTGTYLIQARATDSNGIVVTSAPVTFTVSAQSSIALPGSVGGGGVVGSGVNGSTVNDDTISFTGSFAAPPNSTVTVNGQLAAITASGQFAITNLPLQLGLNTLTILVSNAGGLLAMQTITVTRGLSVKPFRFNVTPSQGSAPLLASIELKNLNNVPVSTIQVSCHNPGRDLALVSYSVANLANSTMSCIYNDPGVWTPWVLIKDPNGVTIYDEQRTVITVDGGNAITVVRAVYATLIDHLKVGNKAGALNQFFGHARGKYDEIFTALGTDLAAFANQSGTVLLVTAGEDFGEVIVERGTGAQKEVLTIYIMKGEDGVWRIESM